ncbi:MAG: hypothetical protein QG556_824 [Pseudomonadota bacterium]|nr:hypothetical protein [Pseudomonadota bacterium]
MNVLNYFLEEWVQELIHSFIKKPGCQYFEYSFEKKSSKFNHSEYLAFNLFSNVGLDLTCEGIIPRTI